MLHVRKNDLGGTRMDMAQHERTPPSRLMPPVPAAAPSPSQPVGDAPQAGAALALLFVVYLFNYLDRTLIFILFGPIKAELVLTDTELALLGSTSFVLFYTTLGVPFGRLADRVSRTRMIAAGLAIWSIASALTGAMHNFYGIFACRVLVGVGEATLGPAALSLLSDLFMPRRRATVSAMFSAGIPIGAGIALLLGGLFGAKYGWRNAFYICGLPGVGLAAIMLLLREPERGRTETSGVVTGASEPMFESLRGILAAPGMKLVLLGYAMFALASNALSMWVPSFLLRNFNVPLATAGRYTGMLVASCGLLGVLGGGVVADFMVARGRGGRLLFSSMGAVICALSWVVLLRATSVPMVLVPFGVLAALGLGWLGPAAADVQALAGTSRRGVAIGVYFFTVNLIGYGIAPPLIGKLSDSLGVLKDPAMMRTSLLACPAAAMLAAVVLFAASRVVERQAAASTRN
jgi:MFS family permease